MNEFVHSLRLRRAEFADHPCILQLLTALELDYPSRNLQHFWVFASENRIAAIAELKEFADFLLLSCVGVEEALQGTGLGRSFITGLLAQVRKPVYLYTLVPAFFGKVGFMEAIEVPAALPPRSYYGCTDCVQQGCLCMVKACDAA